MQRRGFNLCYSLSPKESPYADEKVKRCHLSQKTNPKPLKEIAAKSRKYFLSARKKEIAKRQDLCLQ
jgi:hypothetical protein